jgi:transcription antitermination factor NusG
VVPDEEIEALRNALAVRRAQPYGYIASGTRIRIRSGALKGLDGVVLREKGQARIVVSVDFIMRSVAIELEACDLECLDPVRSQGL